jgi:hypothetical protein
MKIPNKKLLDLYLQDNNVFCPFCGSQNITISTNHYEEFPGIVNTKNFCQSCGMTWWEEFKLKAIGWEDNNGEIIWSDEFDFENQEPMEAA